METGDDFEQFWDFYPRKEGKKDARKAWGVMSAADRFAALQSIPVHVRFWNLSDREKRYMPMAGTWLRGERWSDELEMPAKKSDADWWRSTAGIEAKAREVGIVPKLGEDWMSLKARVMAKVAA
jgi:hypothetical protein